MYFHYLMFLMFSSESQFALSEILKFVWKKRDCPSGNRMAKLRINKNQQRITWQSTKGLLLALCAGKNL